ncbi:heme exporter protein CcmA [Legionella rubrilucens]|uniref:Heme exporter protein CcmA n=1 Tax=Legionella rubrilucens TaxID=458 RepID=A0A0W0XRV7_9GAMM|nr:cytochrome c biogenesis heme-transporting ATPase CcmA [Legionella rubrilucens]KTD47355.1 heme exporter protein CcmA [Legionella rubrilucens]
MLDVINLAYDYDYHPVFNGVQWTLAQGELLHLRGGNGAGKTTLLRLLAGLTQPISGEIRFKGCPVEENKAAYQQALCYVGHKPGLSAALTVSENCLFDPHWPRSRVPLEALLAEHGLHHLADQPCSHLSAGQRRRVSLLRLAMTDAPLWLLDEPLVALDDDAIELLVNLMNTHLQQDGMIVLTSHQELPSFLKKTREYCL